MKQVATSLVLVVLLVLITMVASQLTEDRDNTLMRYYCTLDKGMNKEHFLSNLNNTLSSLHRELSIKRQRFAVAHTSVDDESVWGLALCREYLSIPHCLDCFDLAFAKLKECDSHTANGGLVFYRDCDVRYDDYNFITETGAEARDETGVVLCGDVALPQTTELTKATERLLLDLQIAAPRTSNFYAASTRKVDSSNANVYGFAQCNLNVSQSACLECLKSRSRSIYACLPSTSGKAGDVGCFMRYSVTPFFGRNQTTDITSLLWDGDSNKKRSIIGGVIGGVSFMLLILAFSVWCCRSKITGRSRKDGTDLNRAFNYDYGHLRLATNNFSEDNMIGKGSFGQVFKAILDDKKVVAVKKLKDGYGRAKVEFENEVLLICNIRHRNLLRLLGWSSEASNLLLVLEYMPNGSLDTFLWGGL